MTRQDQKKAEERELLRRFAEANPHLAVSEIQDSEAPDFICATSEGLCGIEVVDFLIDPKRARKPLEIQRYREGMARTLMDEHRRLGIPPMHVGVRLLWPAKLLDPAFRDALKKALLELIAEPAHKGDRFFSADGLLLGDSLYDKGVASVLAAGGPAFSQPFWSFSQTTWVPESTSDMVQAVIDKKEPKVATYRRKLPKLWLLICAGPRGLESIIEATESVLGTEYRSTFDRLFLFRTFGTHTHELKIKADR